MKIHRAFILIGVLIFFSLNSSGQAQVSSKSSTPQYTELSGSQPSVPRQNAPVILDAYAIDRGIYGTVLRIYLEAEDRGGEMAKIATTVDGVGYGHYPTDFIILKSQYRSYFKGYIQWNTFSSHIPTMNEWVRVYVAVTVMDKRGNPSNEFVFPFTFETVVESDPKPPAPFDQASLPRIGSVAIDLFDPFRMGGGNGDSNEKK